MYQNQIFGRAIGEFLLVLKELVKKETAHNVQLKNLLKSESARSGELIAENARLKNELSKNEGESVGESQLSPSPSQSPFSPPLFGLGSPRRSPRLQANNNNDDHGEGDESQDFFPQDNPRSTFGNGMNDSIESTQSPLLRDPTQSDEIESETQRESEGEGEGEGESEEERPAKKPRRVSLADRGFVLVNKQKAPVQPSSGPSQ